MEPLGPNIGLGSSTSLSVLDGSLKCPGPCRTMTIRAMSLESITLGNNITELVPKSSVSSPHIADLPRLPHVMFDPFQIFQAIGPNHIPKIAASRPVLHVGTNTYDPNTSTKLQPINCFPAIDISFPTWERVGLTVHGDVLFIHRCLTQAYGKLFSVVVPANVETDSEDSDIEYGLQETGITSGMRTLIDNYSNQFLHLVGTPDLDEGQKFRRVLRVNKPGPSSNNAIASYNSKENHITKGHNNNCCSEMEYSNSSHSQTNDRVPNPLHIRKQPSNSNFAQTQTLNNSNPYKSPTRTRFPPRTSPAIGMPRAPNAHLSVVAEKETPRSTASQWTDERVSDTSSEGKHSARSTVEDIQQNYITSPSSEIMGNFVPISPGRHSADQDT